MSSKCTYNLEQLTEEETGKSLKLPIRKKSNLVPPHSLLSLNGLLCKQTLIGLHSKESEEFQQEKYCCAYKLPDMAKHTYYNIFAVCFY